MLWFAHTAGRTFPFTSRLKYHLNAKHSFVGASASGISPGMLQTTLTEHRALSKTIFEKMTDTMVSPGL